MGAAANLALRPDVEGGTMTNAAPIASLTTSVPVARSIDQIRRLVERFGAREFRTIYEANETVAIRFAITDPNNPGTVFSVSLRAPTEVLFRMMRSRRATEAGEERDLEQARRVAWRNLHDFVRASLIGVQTGLLSVAEAFMANLVVDLPNGEERRLSDALLETGIISAPRGRLLLGAGNDR